MWPYVLTAGHSDNPAKGACAMDAINWLCHGQHGDEPECTSPVIGKFVITFNDSVPNDIRQRLLGYLSRIAGSRSNEHEQDRRDILKISLKNIFNYVKNNKNVFIFSSMNSNFIEGFKEAMKIFEENLYKEDDIINVARTIIMCSVYPSIACADESYKTPIYDMLFETLDAMLKAGPQGEPWSADVVEEGLDKYIKAGGLKNKLETV